MLGKLPSDKPSNPQSPRQNQYRIVQLMLIIFHITQMLLFARLRVPSLKGIFAYQHWYTKRMYSIIPLSPPIWNFQPSVSMYIKLGSRKLVLHLPPYHVYSITLFRRVLVLKMMANLLKIAPHFNPSSF